MPDVFTPAKRSEVMSRIRSTGNAATELRLVALLRAAGITGWRRHVPLPLGLVPASRSSSDSSSPGHRSPKSAGGPGHRSSKRAGGPGLRSSQSEGGSAKGKAKARTTSASTTPRRLRVRPDFIFRAARVAVFVDGCFWHGCPRHGTRPRQNRKFWDEKIARNRERDHLVTRRLRQLGWTVLRLWECALSPKRQPATLARLRRALGK